MGIITEPTTVEELFGTIRIIIVPIAGLLIKIKRVNLCKAFTIVPGI